LDIDQESGRALEAAIAQRVFRLETEERPNTRTRERDFVCREPGKQWVVVPYYTRNLSARVKVELALQALGWKAQPSNAGNGPEMHVVLVHTNGRTVEAVGHQDEALCRAALKAVEQP
jgi:hypothetical protein